MNSSTPFLGTCTSWYRALAFSPNRWFVVATLAFLCAGLRSGAQPVALLSYSLVTNQVGVTYNVPVTDTDPGKYALNQP
jgi:hypothetical protein